LGDAYIISTTSTFHVLPSGYFVLMICTSYVCTKK